MRYLFKIIIVNILFPCSVLAETAEFELAPITVTGSKSMSPSFNTQAMSKNVLTGQEVTERGLNNISDITQRVANFHLTNAGLGSLEQRFSMRGLMNTQLFSDPSVVFYVDDVPYTGAASTLGHLFNLESVDVYRSAQPGRFGKNAYAGAVDIKTKQPTNALSGGLALELGSFNLQQVTVNGSGALINDRLFLSVSGEYQARDGFIYNSYLNTHPNEQENYTGRATLKWTPTQNWDIRFTATKEDFNAGAAQIVRTDSPSFYTVRAELSEYSKQTADSQSLRVAYNAEDIEILSVTNRRFLRLERATDLNLTLVPFNRVQDLYQKSWSQEFRLQPKNKHTDWNWQAGLFYTTIDRPGFSDTVIANNITAARSQINKLSTENYAAFGQLSYQGFENLKASFDLRFDYIDSRVDAENIYLFGNNISLKQRDEAFFISPKFAIDYTFSPNLLIYAASSLSSKRPGFTIANSNQNVSFYKKEAAWQNEIGLKTNWFDKRLNFNLTGFYYDIDNYQVERFFSPLDYGITNAAKAHSYGFEVESKIKIRENLWLENSLGYTHMQFDRYIDPVSNVNYAGKLAPNIPDFTSTVALQYKNPEGYFARAEWLWTGKTYFDENNTAALSQNAYSTANLRIGYAQKNYSIYGFATNITNNHYYTFKGENSSGVRGAPSDPRMIGVRLGVNF